MDYYRRFLEARRFLGAARRLVAFLLGAALRFVALRLTAFLLGADFFATRRLFFAAICFTNVTNLIE